MRRLLILLGILLALGVTSALPASASDTAIEDLIDREMPASGVPGLSYAVVEDGVITSVGVRGVVRSGTDREVAVDTPFATGSISKSFTALAVMQLVEAGTIDLDAPVSTYLDTFAGTPVEAITIRQLLSHTSGYSTFQGNSLHADATASEDELARIVDRLAETSPADQPDENWQYSNANYAILGRVIEVVSGEEFQAYITSHILQPLGMDNSFVADGDIHEAIATGHRPWFLTKLPVPDATTDRGTAPQGGVFASAHDVALYMAMMMNGQDDLISAQGKTLMMRPASAASPFYGLGWFLDTGNGTVWHSGSTPGVETLATMVPAESKGVVVLVNGGSGTGFGETTQLRNGITATALGLDYDGEGSRWSQQALFIGLTLLPIAYVISMIWAWRHRAQLRAKTGAFGLFSLWFPLITTLVAAWVMLFLVPSMIGAPIATIALFQPDFGLLLIASAVTGVLWAVFRLAVAYTGRSGTASNLPASPPSSTSDDVSLSPSPAPEPGSGHGRESSRVE